MLPDTVRAIERLIVVSTTPLLLYIGYRLFVLGVTGQMKITASLEKWKATLVNIAPGSFCFLIAVLLAGYVLWNKVPLSQTLPPPVAATAQSAGQAGPAAGTAYWMGEARYVPLSAILRNGLSQLYLCEHEPGGDVTACRDQYLTKFQPVTREDLRQIEALEKQAAENKPEAADKLATLKRNYIK